MLDRTRSERNRRVAPKRGLRLENLEDRVTPIAPIISTLMPMDDAGDVDVASNLVVQFDREVEIGSGNIRIREIGTDTLVEQINVTSGQVSLAGDTLTIDPSSDLPVATPVYVTIDPGAVRSLTTSQGITEENFNGLNLSPASSNEGTGLGDGNDFTLTPPPGWTRSFNGNNGVGEFNGWSFIDDLFWDDFSFFNNSPGGEGARNEFMADDGTPFAVADAANWGWTLINQTADPAGSQPPGDTFETTLTTPSISLTASGVEPNSLRLVFDSSWVIDNNGTQQATITVSYDGSAEEEVLVWTTDSADANFKPSNTNETITVELDNPAGASEAKVSFNFSAEDDDRWWAFDNVEFIGEVAAAPGTGDPFDGLTGVTEWNFSTTGIDGEAPQIVRVMPMPGATNVPLDTIIQIEFDEVVQAGRDGFIDVRLTTDNPLLDNTVLERVDVNSSQISINNNLVTVTLSDSLPDSTQLYLYLSPGAFTDTSANFNTTTLLIEDFEGVEPIMRDSPLANDGAAGVDLNDYVLFAEGQLEVLQDGEYTFGLTSDDGGSLRVFDANDNIVAEIRADVLRGIGPVDLSASVNLTAGEFYRFEYFYFERGGGSAGEAMYAPGAKTGFDEDFRLIGDASQGIGIVGEITATTLVAASATIDSLADAEGLINGSTPQADGFPQSAPAPVVDFLNTGGSGRFTVDLNVPGTPPNTPPEDFPNRDFATLEDAQSLGNQLLGWQGEAAPEGGREEYFGWTILDKNWWINQQGNQDRDRWLSGVNNVLVADGDAYDDGFGIPQTSGNFLLTTPEIATEGLVGDVTLAFDSSFRPYDIQRATIEVRFDGGSWMLIDEFTNANSGGNSAFNRIDDRPTYDVSLPDGATNFQFRFGYLDFDNDWYWAIDNLEVTGTGLVGNPSETVTDPTQFSFQTRDDTRPSIASLTPADDAVEVDSDADLILELDEPVMKGTGNIEIRNQATDSIVESIDVNSAAVSIDGSQVTIDPVGSLPGATGLYVLIDEGAITDTSAQANPFGISDPDTWNFVTEGAFVELVFQQGVEILENGDSVGVTYSGTQDADPAGQAPNDVRNRDEINPDGSDGGQPVHGLTQFADLFGDAPGQIPAGSIIESATLAFTIVNEGTPLNLHRMLQPWDQSQITWNGLGQTPFNSTPGIQGDGVDATAVLQTFAAPVSVTALDVTDDLQLWSNGEPNYGWGFTPTGNNGVDWLSAENSDVGGRPKLTVIYRAPLAITSLTPADDSTTDNPGVNLQVGFNAIVTKGSGNISIFRSSDDALVEAIDVASEQVTVTGSVAVIDPSIDLVPGESYYVNFASGTFIDPTQVPLFSENFDSLTLFDSPLASDGDDESDFTTLTRAQELGELTGWTGSVAPEGGPEEYAGFTFLDKNFWIAQQGNQDRDRWTGGTGVVVVADGDAYDDGFGIPNREGMFFLTTPEIPTDEVNQEVTLSFNSTFRPYDVQRATIEVRFDGGEWMLLDEFTNENSGGNSAFNRIDDQPSYTTPVPDNASNVQYRFGYLDFDNDWWFAIDNVQVTTLIDRSNAPSITGPDQWNFTVGEDQGDVPVSTTITRSGVDIAFDRPMDVSVLNLYEDGNLAEPDLVLTGPNGDVSGSLIPDATGQNFQFVATGGPLEAGDYTLTLISGANAFVGTDGELLDGDFDGTPGGDYVETFTVAAISDVVVSVADFARFAGQAVVVPNTGAGLPITLSDATGVTELSVEIAYNPAVLTITGAEVAEGLPADTTVNVDTSTEGLALVTFSSPSALSGTELSIVELVTSVPSDAPAAVGQVLTLGNVSINGGSIGGIGDSAVHAAAYFGDVNNDGSINVSDVTETLQVAGGTDAGFAGVALVDPRLVGDINGDGLLTVSDVSILLSAAAGQQVAQIPLIP